MKALLLLLFVSMGYSGLNAQDTSSVTVKAGSNIKDALTTTDIFYYPEFTKGEVFFRHGTRAVAKLNYSRLVDEMHFLNPKGDTLALSDEGTIQSIHIDKDSFYFDQGWVRLVAGNKLIKLAEKQAWFFEDKKKIVAYNTSSTSAATNSITSFNANGRIFNLIPNEDVVIRKGKQYFFGDKYNHFVPALKKNLVLLFPKEQRVIEAYLKENKVDFNNREDLEKVVQFLEHL
ncbi:MAG: hypothetical protein V4722_06290 [Bacteroidota bacterium]